MIDFPGSSGIEISSTLEEELNSKIPLFISKKHKFVNSFGSMYWYVPSA
jgi:hypothetical protein